MMRTTTRRFKSNRSQRPKPDSHSEPVNQHAYGATGPKRRAPQLQLSMAIASPKKKDELARQFKVNPEVDNKLNEYMKSNPDLVQYVKDLPREQLERKFLLRKMKDEEQKQGYTAKIKAWLAKPEQADLVQSIKSTISPNMKPERQEGALLTAAKNHVRNNGIKLG
jgi:hypothetical protein